MEDQRVYKMNAKEKTLFVLIQLFFIATIVPSNNLLAGVITGSMMLGFLLFNSFREKGALLKGRSYIIWMFLFFVWIFFSVLISKDIDRGFGELDPRLPFLYFPLTIGLIKLNTEFKERILLGFALIVTAFCIVSLTRGIYYYSKTGNSDSIYSDGLVFYADRTAIYIAVLVNFSIYIISKIIFFKNHKYKGLFVLLLIFLLLMNFLLASRNMLFVLSAFIIGFLIHYIIKRKQYMVGLTLLVSIGLLSFGAIKLFPKTLNRFMDFNYISYEFTHEGSESNYSKPTTADQWNGANFRLAAWKCGWELFKEHPITGVHIGDKKEKLIEKYNEKNFQFVIKNYKNVHNNYLDILFGTGIIGLLLFFIGWLVLPLRICFIYKDYLSAIIIITYAIATITEVYFDRSFGGMLFGFFIPFLLVDKKG
ncbi:MAG: O-antigen ligase family protein [Bacteroidetes bacterium]|nr:O-antigen ligase family protein [Bacteroidota bacterium]